MQPYLPTPWEKPMPYVSKERRRVALAAEITDPTDRAMIRGLSRQVDELREEIRRLRDEVARLSEKLTPPDLSTG